MRSNLNKIFKKKENIPTYFIAEIGVNHNGKISLAKKMIDSAKKSGANAVKFQTFKAERLATPSTPKVEYQKKFSSSNQSHFEMLKSLELSNADHRILKKYCEINKIDFISTPYDLTSAKFLSKIGCKYFKTSSADIVDLELHEYLAKTKKYVIISTGMSTEKEIENCINVYKKYQNNRIILLHCVSNYPCSLESLNLNVLPRIKKKFKYSVGFSDHSLGHAASVASVALGAKVIEKHFTINKKFKGPDHNASSSPKEFKKIVDEIKKLEIIMGNDIKKCQKEELQMSRVSRKSLTLTKSLKKGDKIKFENLCLKRPGTGIFFKDINKVLGKRLKKNLKKNYQIKFNDLRSK